MLLTALTGFRAGSFVRSLSFQPLIFCSGDPTVSTTSKMYVWPLSACNNSAICDLEHHSRSLASLDPLQSQSLCQPL